MLVMVSENLRRAVRLVGALRLERARDTQVQLSAIGAQDYDLGWLLMIGDRESFHPS